MRGKYVAKRVYNTVLELFVAVRHFARDTNDPSYQPIGQQPGSEKKQYVNNSAEHKVPWDCYLRTKNGYETVHAGTEVLLYQEPDRVFFEHKKSVGTLFLAHTQISVRGDGRVNYRDMEKWRQRTALFGLNRVSASSKSSNPDDSVYNYA